MLVTCSSDADVACFGFPWICPERKDVSPARKVIIILTKIRGFPAGKVKAGEAQTTVYVGDTGSVALNIL